MIDTRTYWALRALLHMATAGAGSAAVASDVAEAIGAPPDSVAKVLRRLALAGILTSQRGSGGGFSFARPLTAITAADVYRAMGDRLTRLPPGGVPALALPDRGESAPHRLQTLLATTRDDALGRLASATLADLAAAGGHGPLASGRIQEINA